jgi:hypothetical protein
MANYVLYCLDGSKLVRCERFRAETDNVAIAEAVRRQGSSTAELWSGSRKVTILWPAHAASCSADAVSSARLTAAG